MKKVCLLVIVVLSVFLITGCDTESTNSNASITNIEQTEKTNQDSKNNYMDALRKCTVMEAADIYTTGVGKKSDNVFNDGRETCETFYKQWGEKDFIDTVNADWENRQNEQIDGKPLTHYLEVLGW